MNSWKKILAIAWPLIIANSFWNLQLTIDRIFLGMHSTEALGAAMAVMGVFWVPMALLQQTASYVTTFIAQYFGAKKLDQIGASLWQGIYVSFVGGILFLGLIFVSPSFFNFVGHPENIRILETEYFNALCFSALPMALVAAFSGFFTGLGQTKTVIGINFIGLILNVLFDYILIFGNFGSPAMGITGAGYATALATVGGALFGALLIFRPKYEAAYQVFSNWKFKAELCLRFLKYGIPSGLQWAFEGLAFTTFLIIMGNLKQGEAALAGSSIAVTLMMLSVLPSMGIAQAVMTLVGQKLGEKKPDEAQHLTWEGAKISSIYMALVGLSFVFFPDFFIGWFENKSNTELWAQVQSITPDLLKFVALFTIFDSVYLNISFALKGAGDTRFVSYMALAVPWPLMVLPTFMFKEHPLAVQLAWAFASLYVIAITIILVFRFRQGKWKFMSVTGDEDS